MKIDAAKSAVGAEWDRLRDKRRSIEPKAVKDVVCLDQIIRNAKASGTKIHLGRLFDICVLKVSELPEGHVNRKLKGRVVFGGNNVQDEFGMAATSPEAGSGASYGSASKLFDAVPICFPATLASRATLLWPIRNPGCRRTTSRETR